MWLSSKKAEEFAKGYPGSFLTSDFYLGKMDEEDTLFYFDEDNNPC